MKNLFYEKEIYFAPINFILTLKITEFLFFIYKCGVIPFIDCARSYLEFSKGYPMSGLVLVRYGVRWGR